MSLLVGNRRSLLRRSLTPREQLIQVLSAGNTVADYDASLGITGALNASAWANQIGAAGPLLQATGANQPIVLSRSGSNYAYLPAVINNYIATPDSAANSVTGPIAIAVRVALNDWTPAVINVLICKDNTSGGRCWVFQVNDTTGKLQFTSSANGAGLAGNASSVGPGLTDATSYWIGASQDATETKYWTAPDSDITPAAASWTQLGTAVAAGSATIFDGAVEITLGMLGNHQTFPLAGRLKRAQIYNGIPPMFGGAGSATPVNDFNAADWPETSTNGATKASSTTGEVWTLNNTGATPAQIVGSPSLLADGTAHKMATANFTLDQPIYEWIVAKQITYTAGDWLASGTAGAAGIVATTGTPSISVNAGSNAAENAGATLGSYHVVEYCINGASSYISIDGGAQTTGDAGAGNPGGLSLFSDNAGANYGNWQVKERIVRTAPGPQIQSLLKAIYGTP